MNVTKSLWRVLGLSGLLAVGCAGPKPSTTPSGSSPVAAQSSPSASLEGQSNPPAKGPEPKPAPTKESTAKVTPPKTFEIAEPRSKGWGSTDRKLEDLAARVGKTVAGMKGIYGEALTSVQTAEGKGRIQSVYKIRDNKMYSISFPVVNEVPTRGETRADGKLRIVRTVGAFGPRAPVGSPTVKGPTQPSDLVERWPREFGQLMFLNLTDGKDAWGPVLSALARGEGGFQTTLEERSLPWKGQMVRNYRVRAVRSPEAAKRLGPCEMEMVFDGERFLPVTVRVDMKDAQGKPWKVEWSGAWSWTRPIDPKDLALP